jgi:hypothetical protein
MSIVGFDGPGEALEGIPNALMGKRLVALDECRRADHIGVQHDGELSRRVFCHEEALFFEFGASASRYYRGSGGVASERLQLH